MAEDVFATDVLLKAGLKQTAAESMFGSIVRATCFGIRRVRGQQNVEDFPKDTELQRKTDPLPGIVRLQRTDFGGRK